MELSSLARTLAERMMSQHPNSCHECVEAVIREAIEKTLEEAAQSITRMLTDPRPYPFSQHVELAIKACAAEVALLKQGIEAEK